MEDDPEDGLLQDPHDVQSLRGLRTYAHKSIRRLEATLRERLGDDDYETLKRILSRDRRRRYRRRLGQRRRCAVRRRLTAPLRRIPSYRSPRTVSGRRRTGPERASPACRMELPPALPLAWPGPAPSGY